MPFVTNGEMSIHYEVAGRGPVLVLVHGVGSSGEVWRRNGYVEALAPSFTVVTVDQRGHGESSPVVDASELGFDRRGADIEAVLDAVGAERVILFGFSLGGVVSTFYAGGHPERVAALIAAAANPMGPWTNRRLAFRDASLRGRASRAIAYGRFQLGRVRRRIFGSGHHRPPRELMPEFQRRLAAGDRSLLGGVTTLEGLREALRMPALFFQGERDGTFAVELTRAFAESLPDARFVAIAGVDHQLLQRPELVLPIVRPFLDEVRDRATVASPREDG
jgi:pimeloyl-ACP methyl ester carboxylesterase